MRQIQTLKMNLAVKKLSMISKFFKKWAFNWKLLLTDRAYNISFIVGILVFVGAFVLNYYVSAYNDSKVYLSVGDLILNSIPTYDLDFIFTWGIYFVVMSFSFYVTLFRPELIPFVLKTFGLLLIVRCGFITLIHVGPPEGFFYDEGVDFGSSIDPLRKIIFKNDLFFSGHTSIPFMGFLLLERGRFRWFMLFSSIVMGITVLLMHVHYSIDVFAAFFITHGIYSLSNKVFKDLNLRFQERLSYDKVRKIQKKITEFKDRQRGRILDRRKGQVTRKTKV